MKKKEEEGGQEKQRNGRVIDVCDANPTARTWLNRKRPPQISPLKGARNREGVDVDSAVMTYLFARDWFADVRCDSCLYTEQVMD